MSAAITFFLVWLDTHSRLKQEVETLSHLGRQVSAQVETLALVGMQLGRPQPFHWATQQINQGIDPRFISANVKQATDKSESSITPFSHLLPQEKIELDRKTEILLFNKQIRPENPVELEIRLMHRFTGFLGSRSKAINDLYVFLCFFALTALQLSFIQTAFQKRRPFKASYRNTAESSPDGSVESVVLADSERISETSQGDLSATSFPFTDQFKDFYGDLKQQMKDVNLKWKNYIQNRIQLTNQLYRTQKDSNAVKVKAHEALNEVHHVRRSMEKMGILVAQTKQRLVESELQDDLKKQIMMWMDALAATQKSIRSIEVKLEPITLEADLTFQGMLDLCAMQENLAKALKESGDAMIQHAKAIHEFKSVIEVNSVQTQNSESIDTKQEEVA